MYFYNFKFSKELFANEMCKEKSLKNNDNITTLTVPTNRNSKMLLTKKFKNFPKVLLVLSMFYFLRTIATDEEAVEFNWEPYQYPNLGIKSAKHCAGRFRNPPTSVCDPDNVMRASEANNIDSIIDKQQNGTACLCPPCSDTQPTGLVIKVAAVHSFKRDHKLVWTIVPLQYN